MVLKKSVAVLLALLLAASLLPSAFAEDEITVIDPVGESGEPAAAADDITVIDPAGEGVEPTAAADEEILGSGDCGSSLTWTLTGDGTLTISGYGYMEDYSAENRPGWYELRGEIRSLVFRGGEYVGSYAFADCGALTSATFLVSISYIYEGAFSGCGSLQVLRLYFEPRRIAQSAFAGCQALSDVWCSAKENEWSEVQIDEGNEALQNARFHFPQSKPVITSAPESLSVRVGETVLLSVEVEGEGDFVYHYQWQYMTSQRNPNDESLWSNCSNGNSSSLTVIAESYRNGYHYRCKVYNGYGVSKTDYITLSVGFPITVQPEDAWLTVGETAIFSVEAEGATAWQWQYRASESSAWKDCTGSGAKTATLSVEGKSYRNGYAYRCLLSDGEVQTYSRIATLRVFARPMITKQPQSQSVGLDKNARFEVTAAGEDMSYISASYQWQYRPGGSSSWNNCSNGTRSYLIVQGKSYRSGYQYRCIVTNMAGTSAVSEPATLTVFLAAPQILSQPSPATAQAGETVVFTVEAKDAEQYQWEFKTPGQQNWNSCSAPGATGPSFPVEALSYRDGYQYRCAVKNACGTTYSEAVTLRVTAGTPPAILTQPESTVTAAKGETVTLTVTASGPEPLNYQWYYRTGSSGYWNKCTNGAAPSLDVEAKSYRNGYQYRCQVKNASGQVYSNPVTLTVQ